MAKQQAQLKFREGNFGGRQQWLKWDTVWRIISQPPFHVVIGLSTVVLVYQLTINYTVGTETELLSIRPGDHSEKGFDNWPFMSVHTWGEQPAGQWKLTIRDTVYRGIDTRPVAPIPWSTGARAPTFTNGWARGAPWVAQLTRNHQTVLTITKALTKMTNTLSQKKWRARLKNSRRFAPDRCLPTLSNSFRRHCSRHEFLVVFSSFQN